MDTISGVRRARHTRGDSAYSLSCVTGFMVAFVGGVGVESWCGGEKSAA